MLLRRSDRRQIVMRTAVNARGVNVAAVQLKGHRGVNGHNIRRTGLRDMDAEVTMSVHDLL